MNLNLFVYKHIGCRLEIKGLAVALVWIAIHETRERIQSLVGAVLDPLVVVAEEKLK